MIRPSAILGPIAKDLFAQAQSYAAAAAIVAAAGFLSMKVEDAVAARLEARKVASLEVEKPEEDLEDIYAAPAEVPVAGIDE